MSLIPAGTQYNARLFDQACSLIAHSQTLQDKGMLCHGLKIMRSNLDVCQRIENGAHISLCGLRNIRARINFRENIREFRHNKGNREYFECLVHNFPPQVEDITYDKHRREIDTLLVKSLISHDNRNGWNNYKLKSSDFDELLKHLGKTGSRDAFACVLNEALRRLHEQGYGAKSSHPLELRLLPLINDFTQPSDKPTLPGVILEVIAHHPAQMLAEQNKHPAKAAGALHMRVLQAMLDGYASNETMMDVTLEMVRKSLWHMNDHRELLWAEQLGIAIDAVDAGKTLINSWYDLKQHTAALYYLLCSPNISAQTLNKSLGEILYLDSSVYQGSLLSAGDTVNANGQMDELFVDKTIVLLKHLMIKTPSTAKALLGKNVVPSKMLMKDHTLRDYLMAADLGL